MAEGKHALKGLMVQDFTRVNASPFYTRQPADLSAEVIKKDIDKLYEDGVL